MGLRGEGGPFWILGLVFMPVRFPALEPYETGMLDVGDGQRVYWEASGNPAGKAAVALHGGPGSGSSPGRRRAFDPDAYRLIQFDQRAAGGARPRSRTRRPAWTPTRPST
jgi:proline iminopeptidase